MLFAALGPVSAAPASPGVDDRARHLISGMVGAYRSLRTFEQETTYDDADRLGDLAPARLHVLMRRPNRLLLQVWRNSSRDARPQETRVVCDGKSLWTWTETPGYYQQEKAPKNLAGFRDRIASIDLAMLFGFDPFAELLSRARAARVEDPASVDEVDCDVVLIDMGTDDRSGLIRLSIGQKDHLLRRFVYETKDLTARPAASEGSAPQPASAPASRFSYTNHVTANGQAPEAAFRWIAPAGAFRYTPYPSLGNLGDLKTIPGAQDPDLTTKPQKLIPLQDYIKRSKKIGKPRP